MMQRRPEFSFPGSPARGLGRALPPRPPANVGAPRPSDEEEVRWLQASRQGSPDYASSGTPSPPLWAHHGHDHHRDRLYPASAGSSPSRAQAIAGYRREMLDLMRGLPESAYELSLRDIVERPSSSPPSPPSATPLPTPLPPPPPTPPPAAPSSNASAAAVAPTRGHERGASADEQAAKQPKQGRKNQQRAAAVRRQRSRSLERSVSLDTGLLIKFFMPLSIGGRGKKKVSPKPDSSKDSKKKKNEKKKQQGSKDSKDEEWWKKSEFSEAGSSSRTSSTGSSNDSIRNGVGAGKNDGGGNPRAPVRSRSRKRNGCYGFFRPHKSKNGVSQD